MAQFSNFFRGRINRRNFTLGMISVHIVVILLWYSITTSMGYQLLVPIEDEERQLIYHLLTYGFLAILELFVLQFVAKRLHDIGNSGIFSLLVFVPLIGPVFQFFIGVVPGNAGKNSFGPPPQSRTSLKDTFGL